MSGEAAALAALNQTLRETNRQLAKTSEQLALANVLLAEFLEFRPCDGCPSPTAEKGTGESPLGCTPTMNVPYRTVNGKTLYADAYCPGSPPDLAPAVLLVAGNEWQGGGRTLLSPFVPDFTGAGFVTAVADYRTCPPAGTDHFPSAPQDIIAALAWLRGIPGVDPNRVGVFGSSGGGEIAGVVAISEPRPRCVVSLSGPMDMRIPPSPATGAVYKNYMGCPMSSCPGNWDNASPITHVDAGFPPTWLASSVGDPIPVAGARAMDSALAAAGVDRKYRELEGSEHGLAYWSEVKDEVLAWLTAHLA